MWFAGKRTSGRRTDDSSGADDRNRKSAGSDTSVSRVPGSNRTHDPSPRPHEGHGADEAVISDMLEPSPLGRRMTNENDPSKWGHDRPATKVARRGLALAGIGAFVFALVCAGSIKSSAMTGGGASGLAWLFFIGAAATAIFMWAAAGSDKIQPTIDTVSDRSLDVAAATLRGLRTASERADQKLRSVAAEIDRKSKS